VQDAEYDSIAIDGAVAVGHDDSEEEEELHHAADGAFDGDAEPVYLFKQIEVHQIVLPSASVFDDGYDEDDEVGALEETDDEHPGT
jgi:hypothetical protein